MTLRMDRLAPPVRAKAAPFLEDLVRVAGADLHSLHVVGSAVTPDWTEGRSDINTLLVLRVMNLAVLESIAPLGKRHRRSGIAPPLVTDTSFITGSLDAFPMEYFELKLIHETVAGEDLLAGLVIAPSDLRRQCEREIRSRLVGLRQAYLRSLGEPKALAEALARFLTGYQSLARGIISLLGREVPVRRAEVFAALAAAAGHDAGVFTEMLALKEGRAKPDAETVRALFERCHHATEQLGRTVDALAV
jgi:hypothetical protein